MSTDNEFFFPEGQHELVPMNTHNNNQHSTITTKDQVSCNSISNNVVSDDAADDDNVVISIVDAIERLGMGTFQRRVLVAAGLCFAADSMEILLLSFLAIVLQVQWQLTDKQTASITSSVFIGAMLGTLLLGPLGDRMGRKPVFIITAAIIAVFGLLTAVANNFTIFVFFRFMVGFGVGGLTVPFDTLAEFVPTSHRGSNLLAIEYFWTFGTLFVPVLAYFSLGDGTGTGDAGQWRIFVVLCSLPCFLSTIVGLVYVPESPRWLLSQGKQEKALAILRHAAVCNGKDPFLLFPGGTRLLHEAEEDTSSSSFFDLLAPEWRRTVLFMWAVWAGQSFTYYGTIMVVTLVFTTAHDVNMDTYSFDYGAILASASSEIAGTTLVILTVDRWGRIPCQVATYVLGGCCVFILCLLASQEHVTRSLLVVTAFFSRMFFMSASCTTWVSTAEILTTKVRTTGHSAANAIARLSASFSPMLVTASTPPRMIGMVLLAISSFTAVCAWNLPETRGKRLGSVPQMNARTDASFKHERLHMGEEG